MKKIKDNQAIAAFLGYNGYPASSCISINEEIVHGIPSANRFLKNGDIVSVDIGVKYKDYIADATLSYAVGKISKIAQDLLDVTYQSLYEGIKQVQIKNRIGDIGYTIQQFVENHNFNVVRDFVGHGVGKELHEDPQIPNYGDKNTGPRIKEGMVLAIEPMVLVGDYKIFIKANNWTVCSADHSLAAHYEHTIAVTKDGPKILTI